MKTLIILILCVAIFGTTGYVGYTLWIKPQKIAKEEAKLPPPTPPPDPIMGPLEKARKLHKDGKLIEARDALEAALHDYPESKRLDDAKDELGEVNSAI